MSRGDNAVVAMAVLALAFCMLSISNELRRVREKVVALETQNQHIQNELDLVWADMREAGEVEQPLWVDHPIWKTGGARKPQVRAVVRE